MIQYIKKCRFCDHKDLKTIVNLKKQTIQGAFIYQNKPEPVKDKIDCIIKICNINTGGCGLVQNSITIDPNILYSNYGYRSSVSGTMRKHLRKIAKDSLSFLNKNNIKVFKILDIGANDLYLLKQYPPNIKKVGIDPSDIINQNTTKNIKIFNNFYPNKKIEDTFDIILSIACFYDINNPLNFCKSIEKNLNQNGIWIVELAYLNKVIKNLAYDGMVHEHLCLYSMRTFENILKKSNLKILRVQENNINGGSLQIWVVKDNNNIYKNEKFQNNIIAIRNKELRERSDYEQTYKDFCKRIINHKNELIKLLKKFKKQNKIIHIYGMSTKLNTILSYCGIGPELIHYAAERSKEKIKAKTISGIEIISEKESRKIADVYLVGPYHFKKEILNREKKIIDKGIKFIFPLPKITIV